MDKSAENGASKGLSIRAEAGLAPGSSSGAHTLPGSPAPVVLFAFSRLPRRCTGDGKQNSFPLGKRPSSLLSVSFCISFPISVQNPLLVPNLQKDLGEKDCRNSPCSQTVK